VVWHGDLSEKEGGRRGTHETPNFGYEIIAKSKIARHQAINVFVGVRGPAKKIKERGREGSKKGEKGTYWKKE
jgi:hypothetical protein